MTDIGLLELQSDRIEMVLVSHKAPAHVTGGVVTPRLVQYHLAPALGTKVSKVQALAEELALALGVSSVRVSRQGGSMQLEIPRDDARPVKLLSLMAQLFKGKGDAIAVIDPIPLYTAVLGLCDDGAPLLMRLSSSDVAHVLVSGTTGSGKTALCQTIILSLAMMHRRSQLQFVLVDAKRHAFMPLAPLPHLLRPIIGEAAEAASALGELVIVMGLRKKAEEPRIIVVLNEWDELVREDSGKTLIDSCAELIRHGHKVGIHVINSTSGNGTLIQTDFPTRLIGKKESPEDAHIAAGIGGTGAEKLSGRGDFIAVSAGQVLHFQAAYVSAAETEQVVAQLGSVPRRWDIRGRPSLLHQAAALVAGAE